MRCVDRLVFVLCAGLFGSAASAAQIQLVLLDSPGTGFRDNRPANAEAGDNGASTLGEQRVRVLQRAAEIWGAQLTSSVPIRVGIRMIEQRCDADRTILASAGPTFLVSGFPNAPRANTSYHIAQANALSGQDHRPNDNHILATFNSRIDEACSPDSVGWWYGVDADQAVPADRFAMLPVALHELAHGLGFAAQVNLETGDYFGGTPTVWSNLLYDLQAGRHWRSMSAAERVASARNDPHLVWSGDRTSRNASLFLGRAPVLRPLFARGSGEDVVELGLPQFGPGWPAAELVGRAVLVNDGIAATGTPAGTVHDGCEAPFVNGARLAGRIALIERGLCTFTTKVRNAQAHGAIAVVIINNQEGAPPTMAGADPGCVRMYAPSEMMPGSSVSHFHRDAFPNLLMEPGIGRNLFDEVDLTLDLFRDLGWPTPIVDPVPLPPNDCVVGAL